MAVTTLKMFHEIETQIWNYAARHKKVSVLVIHPDFYYSVAIRVHPGERGEMFGVKLNLSTDIKPNEFIIGEKFEVQDDQKD